MNRILPAAAAVLTAGCGDLVGLGGEATPLARVQFEVTGDLGPLQPAC